MYKLHKTCRACGSKDIEPVVNFGLQPLANDFRKPDEQMAGFAPLEVLFCNRCTLAQLSVVVNPVVLYDRYSYVTSTSQTMLEHFYQFKAMLEAEREGELGDVLEIGSNDGRFLSFLKPHARFVLGIDPAQNLVDIANQNGIQSKCYFFTEGIARIFPKFDTIIARHVFAHVDDWHDFIEALDTVSNEKTVIAIEVPYAKRLLERNEFDTIYHEHLSYVTIKSIHALLANTPFRLSAVHHYDIHGGSMVLILSKWKPSMPIDSGEAITADQWRQLGVVAREKIDTLRIEVRRLNFGKAKVAGYGAPAKATLWINSCQFNRNLIEFVHDITPQKQGRLIAGTDIPVIDGTQKLREQTTHAVLFAWNYEAEILKLEQSLIKAGLTFINPFKLKL